MKANLRKIPKKIAIHWLHDFKENLTSMIFEILRRRKLTKQRNYLSPFNLAYLFSQSFGKCRRRRGFQAVATILMKLSFVNFHLQFSISISRSNPTVPHRRSCFVATSSQKSRITMPATYDTKTLNCCFERKTIKFVWWFVATTRLRWIRAGRIRSRRCRRRTWSHRTFHSMILMFHTGEAFLCWLSQFWRFISLLELHHLFREALTAWQLRVRRPSRHFHTRSFHTNTNSRRISPFSRPSRDRISTSTIHLRRHREAASVLNWLGTTIKLLLMTKMLQFRIRWAIHEIRVTQLWVDNNMKHDTCMWHNYSEPF